MRGEFNCEVFALCIENLCALVTSIAQKYLLQDIVCHEWLHSRLSTFKNLDRAFVTSLTPYSTSKNDETGLHIIIWNDVKVSYITVCRHKAL